METERDLRPAPVSGRTGPSPAASAGGARPSLVKLHLRFAFATLLLLAVYYPWSLGVINYAMASTYYSHILLVPFISGWLVYRDRSLIFDIPRPSFRLAFYIILLGLLLTLYSALRGDLFHRDAAWALRISSMLFVWIGCFALVYGSGTLRKAVIPIAFLLFALPLPTRTASLIMEILQSLSADLSHLLFKLVGVPFLRDGYIFSLPQVTIEVAEVCSGLRSFIVLCFLGLLLSYALRYSTWKTATLVAAIVPFTVLTNALRITTIALLAVYVDPKWVQTSHHLHVGKITFAAALLLLSLLAVILSGRGRGR